MIINIPAIERICANSCFIFLFFTTLYYWFKISFSSDFQYQPTGLIGYISSVFSLTIHLFLRWIDSGHFPLSNLYESLLFLAWCLLILHIYFEKSLKTQFLGVLTSPALLCLIAFTDFSLPPELQESSPLVPALQSNWLVMHVTVMIASYAALLLGCLISIAYLIFLYFFPNPSFNNKPNFLLGLEKENLDTNPLGQKKELFFGTEQELLGSKKLFVFSEQNSNLVIPKIDVWYENQQWLKNDQSREEKDKETESGLKAQKFLSFLDNFSYRIIGIGFCFLTLGILSGAVWANETWGNYWSWDPKETWAFITWLTFASYLHSRLIAGWAGSKPAWIASFGFFIVWICYLGVNLLGQGLHSYGFLQL